MIMKINVQALITNLILWLEIANLNKQIKNLDFKST